MKLVNKLISFVLLIGLILNLNILKCDAASASINLSSSSSKVVVGNYITYTVKISSSSLLGSLVYKFDYDTSRLTLVNGTLNAAPVFTGKEKSVTYTFKFKAKARGNATVSFIVNEALDWDGNPLSVNKTTSKTINIITQSELEASYSKNNYLSNLTVDNYNITPAFNKNTTEYSLTLENDIRSINVSGSKDDSRSSVTGLGTHQLNEGANRIEVKVTAQNGSSRVYVLNVTVKELSPIVVEIDNKKLNVIRKKELLTAPNSTYQDTTIKIDGEDVPAFVNNVTKVTLVGLKDEEGKTALYSYANNTYKLYKEFSFNKIIVTEEKIDKIPSGYKKVNLKINDKDITAYQNDESSNFYLIYATNIENGFTNLYQYDSKENTIQLFNQKEKDKSDSLQEKNRYYEYIIIGLGILLAVTYVSILVSILKKGKKKEKYKEKAKKKQENYDNFTDNTDNIDISLKEIEACIENNDKIEENISYKKEKKNIKNKKK